METSSVLYINQFHRPKGLIIYLNVWFLNVLKNFIMTSEKGGEGERNIDLFHLFMHSMVASCVYPD